MPCHTIPYSHIQLSVDHAIKTATIIPAILLLSASRTHRTRSMHWVAQQSIFWRVIGAGSQYTHTTMYVACVIVHASASCCVCWSLYMFNHSCIISGLCDMAMIMVMMMMVLMMLLMRMRYASILFDYKCRYKCICLFYVVRKLHPNGIRTGYATQTIWKLDRTHSTECGWCATIDAISTRCVSFEFRASKPAQTLKNHWEYNGPLDNICGTLRSLL